MSTDSTKTTRKARIRKYNAMEVIEILAPVHGPAEWNPRYNAAQELVYTILSQHTSDLNSERAYQNLMDTFGTLEAVAAASSAAIEDAIRRGGLAKQKSVRIKTILNQVHDEVGSFDLSFLAEMPLEEAKAWLKKFDGIGPKTAAIILCFALGMPAMPVDTHIFRVAQRLRLIGPKVNADKAHDLLEPMVSVDDVFSFHVYLIRHGRQTCKAQRPKCGECVLAERCPSQGKFDKPKRKTSTRKPRSRASAT